MISPGRVAMFSAAATLLIFTPGPDIIYVMTRGVAQGRRVALAAAAGFALGNFVHTFCAVAGLSALITSNARAFDCVRYLGALYLAYLGVRLMKSRSSFLGDGSPAPPACLAVFRQSILANVMNPKVALFFLAFFPQFVDRSQGGVEVQMLLLGTIFVVLTFFCFSLVAVCSGRIGAWLESNTSLGKRVGQLAGGVLVALGVRLAWPRL